MKHCVWLILLLAGVAQAADPPTCDLQNEIVILGAASSDQTVGIFKEDGSVLGEIKQFNPGKVVYACAWEKRFNLLWVRYDESLYLLDPSELKLQFKNPACLASTTQPSTPASHNLGATAGVGCRDKSAKESKEGGP